MGYRSEARQTDKQTDTDNVVYGTQRHRLRQTESQTRGRGSIYQPSGQHLRCHPPPYSIVCRPKISVRENLSQNGPESVDLEMKKICESLQNGWNVGIWSSLPLCQVGGRSGERRRGSERRSVNLPRTFLSLIQRNLTPYLNIPGINWSDISPQYVFEGSCGDLETKLIATLVAKKNPVF